MRLPCSSSILRWPSLSLVLLGCPADDVTSDGGPDSGASTSPAPGSTSSESATGPLPPPTSSTDAGSTAAVDSTGDTTDGAPTGTTAGADIGDPDDGDQCSSCCGNGIIQGTEQCDCGTDVCTPEGLGFAECTRVQNPIFPDRVYTGGILDCSPASCQRVFTQCTWCGDGVINGNETCEPEPPPQDSCASLGLGDAVEPLPCDATCQIDTSSCR